MNFVPRSQFGAVLSALGNAVETFAPGRVNLIGEHTDYNGGCVLPFALDLGLSIQSARVPKNSVRPSDSQGSLRSDLQKPSLVCMSDLSKDALVLPLSELAEIAKNALKSGIGNSTPVPLPEMLRKNWSRYVIGAAALYFATIGIEHLEAETDHLEFRFSSSLPSGAGLSSSAALCCGMLANLQFLFGKPLGLANTAKLAMYTEHKFAGTRCGLMDQIAILAAREGHFALIDFQDFPEHHHFTSRSVKAHAAFADYVLVVFNTGVSHSLADSEYNLRRETCARALQLLNAQTGLNLSSLGAYATPQNFEKTFQKLGTRASQKEVRAALSVLFASAQTDQKEKRDQNSLSGGLDQSSNELLAKRASHAICENFRIDRAVVALESGNLTELDHAMRESHWSLKTQYEVSCDELDFAVQCATETATTIAQKQSLMAQPVLGFRMTGGGFGGSAVGLLHRSIVAEFAEIFSRPHNPYTAHTGKTPRLLFAKPNNGLRIALI